MNSTQGHTVAPEAMKRMRLVGLLDMGFGQVRKATPWRRRP